METINCPYCGGTASNKDSSIIYGGKSYGMMWICDNYPRCNTYVGCNKKTGKPLGTLADSGLRELRKLAHHTFDQTWKDGHMTRNDAYTWLSKQMNLPKDQTHIGMFNAAKCIQVVKLVVDGLYREWSGRSRFDNINLCHNCLQSDVCSGEFIKNGACHMFVRGSR